MTNIRLHGVLAKEYGQNFYLSVGRPKNVLHAIDANRDGFIGRVIQLQKEGCMYEIIINKKRLNAQSKLQNQDTADTIDLVPAIAGSGPVGALLVMIGESAFLTQLVTSVVFAAISYALSPTPEVDQVEGTARASAQSQVFSNPENLASQGAALPLGYGRLRVGSKVIQASIKSYPQHQAPQQAMRAPPTPSQQREDSLGLSEDIIIITSAVGAES
jgi:predicted phage tail protein